MSNRAEQCVCCKWCHVKSKKGVMFVVKDGPSEHWFCDATCAQKWMLWRHDVRVAHVLRLPPVIRVEALRGRTIDEHVHLLTRNKCEVKQPSPF